LRELEGVENKIELLRVSLGEV
jgi:dynein heavy chain